MKIPARLPNSINDLRSGNLFLDADRNVLGIISDGNFISTNPEGWVNVKDFGAVGDGEHDDTEAFKNAINTNKIIYIPEGTYLISETLYIQNYMFGETKHKSIIKKNNNFIGTSLISIGTNINNRKDYINIENLKLDGTDKTVNGIELYGSFAYINNLYIVNCNKGIYGEKAWTNWVTFNNIYNNIIGIHLYDNANNITIFSNEIHHNDSHGIKFEGGFASRIISNGIESNGDYGIYIIGTGTTAPSSVI